MDSATASLIQILQNRVAKFRDAGDLVEARHAASAMVETCQQALTPDPTSIDWFVTSLELRGDLRRELGEYDDARDDYKQAIDQLESQPGRLDQLGRLHANFGAVHDAQGREDRAAEEWEQAMSCFERHDPPLLLDVAAMANNLGFIRKRNDDHHGAETYFLRALEILHSQLGPEHEETATVASNLGALYHAAGYYEQAREIHMMALENRRKLFGENHADTAQSHNNLALALLQTGDRSWAQRHFEKALAGFEALGPECHDDLSAVAENYCSFLRDQGEINAAELIESRVKEVVST